jgi:hypothetical protein
MFWHVNNPVPRELQDLREPVVEKNFVSFLFRLSLHHFPDKHIVLRKLLSGKLQKSV